MTFLLYDTPANLTAALQAQCSVSDADISGIHTASYAVCAPGADIWMTRPGRSLQLLLSKLFIGCADCQYATRVAILPHCSTVILVDRSWEESPTALWTFIATSFGLTIAAITQFKKNQLSLLEALQISNLVWYVHLRISAGGLY